jgi:cytochrome c-type biogenesis protein CcmH/NrfG
VDAYPNSAKAWYELGSAQIEAGQKPTGLQSYQRSLELDPHNVDNAEERSVIAKSGSL